MIIHKSTFLDCLSLLSQSSGLINSMRVISGWLTLLLCNISITYCLQDARTLQGDEYSTNRSGVEYDTPMNKRAANFFRARKGIDTFVKFPWFMICHAPKATTPETYFTYNQLTSALERSELVKGDKSKYVYRATLMPGVSFLWKLIGAGAHGPGSPPLRIYKFYYRQVDPSNVSDILETSRGDCFFRLIGADCLNDRVINVPRFGIDQFRSGCRFILPGTTTCSIFRNRLRAWKGRVSSRFPIVCKISSMLCLMDSPCRVCCIRIKAH